MAGQRTCLQTVQLILLHSNYLLSFPFLVYTTVRPGFYWSKSCTMPGRNCLLSKQTLLYDTTIGTETIVIQLNSSINCFIFSFSKNLVWIFLLQFSTCAANISLSNDQNRNSSITRNYINFLCCSPICKKCLEQLPRIVKRFTIMM